MVQGDYNQTGLRKVIVNTQISKFLCWGRVHGLVKLCNKEKINSNQEFLLKIVFGTGNTEVLKGLSLKTSGTFI